jgi:hypothetical protein
MSAKMIKDGKEYPIGVIPQNVIDDVADLKKALTYKIKSATISGTTDSGGNITVANELIEIINAHLSSISGSARVITPFYGYGYTYLNFKGLDGANVVGASVTVEYKYVSNT